MRLITALLVCAALHPNAFAADCDDNDPTTRCSLAVTAVADFTVHGAEASAFGGFGSNVNTADADGDGVVDLLIGQPGWNGGYGGAAAVIYGPGEGEASSADAGILLEGEPSSYAYFGGAMAGGDYNGDGYDDVLVGAPGSHSAYLFYGPVTDVDSSSDADVVIVGSSKGSGTASAVLIVPDHDGDGSNDLVIGVPGEHTRPGKAMLFSGHLRSTTNLLAGRALSYRGSGHDRTGSALADLGDQNGDGFEDLLVGASLDGEAYVLEGGNPVAALDPSLSVRSAAAAILSGTHGGFGTALAASDLDGDGYGDALVSAPWAHTGRGDQAGLVYAFRGPFSSDLGADDAYVRWEANDPQGSFGFALASGSDVDGDGEPDTLIGDASEAASPWSVTYLQRGDVSGTVNVRNMVAFTADAWGGGVAFLADWNGDGLDELAIGVPSAPSGAAEGHVSVIFSDSLFE
jgi:hypothetical protein